MNQFVKDNTCVSKDRLANIMKYAAYSEQIEGDVVEFGVFNGGSLEFIRECLPGKKIYGIDSFEGLPESLEWEIHKKGEMQSDYDMVKTHFDQFDNVEILKGFSPVIFEKLPKDLKISFCHIDVDLYSSVTDACKFFYPLMVDGGVMIFDDYKWGTTPGAAKAIHDFFDNEKVKFKGDLHWHNKDTNFQYLVIK